MIDDRNGCICGHWEDKHEGRSICLEPECVCDAFIKDTDGAMGLSDLAMDLRGEIAEQEEERIKGGGKSAWH